MTDELLDFQAGDPEHRVDTYSWIPKELDIFYRDESSFLPTGKRYEDLTQEETDILRQKYRFDPLYPGIYQGITGIGSILGSFTGPTVHYTLPLIDEEWEGST